MAAEIALTAHHAAVKKAASEKARLKRCRAQGAPASAPAATAAPGMVEAALAAFAHEVRTPLTGILAISNLLATSDLDERERRWVDTIKAGAEHLASLATLFVDAASSGGPGLGVRQDLFDLRALARNAGDLADRPGGGEGPAIVGRYFGKAAGVCGGRSSPAARRAGKPDRQCGEVHRTRAASRCTVTPMRGPKGKVGVAFAVSDSGIGLTLAEIKRLFRPFSQANVSHRVALRRRRARTVVGQAAGARHGRRHRRDATRAAAAPPSR